MTSPRGAHRDHVFPVRYPACRRKRTHFCVRPGAGRRRSGAAPDEAWQRLRAFTPARIALGRAGHSQTSDTVLAFGLAHAQARDAVHAPLARAAIGQALEAAGFARLDAHSAAADRQQYLRRPDTGRRLDPASRARLAAARTVPGPDVVFVIADGLSAVAAERHALPCCRPCGRCCPAGASGRWWWPSRHAWRWAMRSAQKWVRFRS